VVRDYPSEPQQDPSTSIPPPISLQCSLKITQKTRVRSHEPGDREGGREEEEQKPPTKMLVHRITGSSE